MNLLKSVGINSIVRGVADNVLGKDVYEYNRGKFTWAFSAINGFSPISPILSLMPIKIAIFAIITLILIFAAGIGWWSILWAYIGQAIIITLGAQIYLSNIIP